MRLFKNLTQLAFLWAFGSVLHAGPQTYEGLKVVGIISLPTKGAEDAGVAVLKDKTGKSIIAKVGRRIPGHDHLFLTQIKGKSVSIRDGGSEMLLLWQSGEPTVASLHRPSAGSYDPEPIPDQDIEEFMDEVPLEAQGEKPAFQQLKAGDEGQVVPKSPQEKSEAIQYWERKINRPTPSAPTDASDGSMGSSEDSPATSEKPRQIRQVPTRSFMDLNRKPIKRIDSESSSEF